MPPAPAGDDGCRLGQTHAKPLPPGAPVTVGAYTPTVGRLGELAGPLDSEGGDPRPERRRAGGRGRLHAYAVVTRPRQWVKNVLVVAAPAAAGVLVRDDVPLRVALAFVAFCLLSAGTYVLNDLRDAHEDRIHPRKRHRPIAAGEIEPGPALRYAALLILAGLGLCLAARPLLAVVGAGYVAVTLTYTLAWRRIAFADVAAIAAGFVLRAVAGGVAAPVALSRSFVLVVTFGAVFVAAGKRHAELIQTRRPGGRPPGRPVLQVYTARRLGQLLAASAVLALAAYSVWALEPHPGHGFPWRALTIAPFAACLVRYGVLLRQGAGEAPEELLLEDRTLQLLALMWTVVFALSVHGAR